MRKSFITIAAAVLLLSSCGTNPKVNSEPVRMEGDSLIVNTEVLGASIEGYRGAVPLEVVVIKGKIADIRVLPNDETPRYLNRVMYGLKDKWLGKTISKAYKTEVDAVSGATYTSEAIISNMKLALEELQKK